MTLPTIENDTLDGQRVLFKSLTKSGWMVITEHAATGWKRLWQPLYPDYLRKGYDVINPKFADHLLDCVAHLPTTKCGCRVGEGVRVYDIKGMPCVVEYDDVRKQLLAKRDDGYCWAISVCTVTPIGAVDGK